MSTRTRNLAARGVALWLDDLSRDRITGGGLERLVADSDVTGVTTNPTIFAAALASAGYRDAIRALAGAPAEEVAFELMTADVRAAADVLAPVAARTDGADGWVSIEVPASVADDAAATLAEARRLARHVGRPNVFVKIPATPAGIEAFAAATAEGISVNVTLIFGLARYRQVVAAYLEGLDRAAAAGLELGRIRSVASFFVSRVDAEVDGRLAASDSVLAAGLRGTVAIANCRLALETCREAFETERAQRLQRAGAHPQRLLWASTGVKDPRMRDTRYVDELATEGVVITMPEATLRAVADHGDPRDLAAMPVRSARATLAALGEAGVDYDDVVAVLERRGIEQFARSGAELLGTIERALRAVGSAA